MDSIETNRERFINLLMEITIPDANISGLIEWLDNSDFFIAPASTAYHSSYEGGLCQHSLNVFDTLTMLANTYYPNIYEKSSLIAIGLLHDISKANFYEKTVINKKVYSPSGTKHDNLGTFDWVATEVFKVKDITERALLGTHEEASALMIGTYIPLNIEETLAVMHHHCGMNDEGQFKDLSAHLNKYPLMTLLHTSDFLSTFTLEVTHEQNN